MRLDVTDLRRPDPRPLGRGKRLERSSVDSPYLGPPWPATPAVHGLTRYTAWTTHLSSSAAKYLERFLKLFEAVSLEVVSDDGVTISAVVEFPADSEWDDPGDERQEVLWEIQPDLDDALRLAEEARSAGLLYSDRLSVGPDDLVAMAASLLGWPEPRTREALSKLLSVRVDMVDDGEKSDFFFFHL